MPQYPKIVILTGAGISAESGLGTFRDEDGLWTQVDLEDVATIEGYRRDPDFVHEFYNSRRRNLLAAVPNSAHQALAALERAHQGEVLVVTQNVDDLHERAGSRNLIHMHGELLKCRCEICDNVQPWREDITVRSSCAACATVGRMRPHVVWFGEMPFQMDEIYAALAGADLFISIGTSGNVYPAAGFVEEARQYKARTVELNLEPSEGASLFDQSVLGPATQVVPAFVDQLLVE